MPVQEAIIEEEDDSRRTRTRESLDRKRKGWEKTASWINKKRGGTGMPLIER